MTAYDVREGDRLVMEGSDTEVGVTGEAQVHPKDGSVWVPTRGQGDRYDVWFRLSGDAPAVIRAGVSVYRHSFLAHAATAERPKAPKKATVPKPVSEKTQGALL